MSESERNGLTLLVLPHLAVRFGLNEAIVIHQLYWLLLNPKSGKQIGEKRWIFNTYEQWRTQFFPFWNERNIRRIFKRLEEWKMIESCQPEGRRSRRKYYRVHDSAMHLFLEAANLATSKRPDCPHGKRPKVALPITETTAETSSETSEERKGSHSRVEVRSEFWTPKFRYPATEEQMIEMLEAHGIEYVPDYDGDFFAEMTANKWKIRGEHVYDWIATYDARTRASWPGHPQFSHF